MRKIAGFYFSLFLLIASPAWAENPIPHVLYSTDTVTIQTKTREIKLTLEVAKSPMQMANGLMHRKTLTENGGMIFLFPQKAPVSMWMKNTFISLDMFFIDERGIIVSIAENTVPESTEIISSNEPVTSVIELAAGSAKRLDIAKGDKVIYSHFHE